ncbi:hypothetical protein [Herbaspirillum seropedicae]|uniref:hypothetical protein n=1 Tax=Herbaspirillum seropedicae TaxID=964 RepID=UPI0028612B30|nr:hypothetical protein [Herbaspirillum seropedicae]MDR6396793.1 hypothetical protein [Herbaspirillum seropedicae]
MHEAGYPSRLPVHPGTSGGFSAEIIFCRRPYHFFYPGYIIAPSPEKDISEKIQKPRPEWLFEGKARTGNSDPHRPGCNEHI